jgi:dihydroorotate dehydrogenase
MTLQPLLISAPWGNYLSFPGTTRTYGTFTWDRRGGLSWKLWRISATLRYSWRMRSWRNKLGLPNPGLRTFLDDTYPAHFGEAAILSVYGFTALQWLMLAKRALNFTPWLVELNLSCPNVAHQSQIVQDVLPAVALNPDRLIAKLPPIDWLPMAEALYEAGVRTFHCCNTLATPGGGLSGKALQPYSLWAIRSLRARFGAEVRLIGGGGVTSPQDITAYADAGADHVAVGSWLLNPLHWRHVAVLQRAAAGIVWGTKARL